MKLNNRGNNRGRGNLRPFKSGKSGNPKGRPTLSAIEREARDSSRLEISETWMALKWKTLPELQQMIAKKTAPALELWMASAIIHGIKKGDLTELHRFYDRILGKPRQSVEIGQTETPVVMILPDNGRGENTLPERTGATQRGVFKTGRG